VDEPFPKGQIEVELGIAVEGHDHLWEVAKRLREKR